MNVRIRFLNRNTGQPRSLWEDGNPEVYNDEWFEGLKPTDQDIISSGKTLNVFDNESKPFFQIRLVK